MLVAKEQRLIGRQGIPLFDLAAALAEGIGALGCFRAWAPRLRLKLMFASRAQAIAKSGSSLVACSYRGRAGPSPSFKRVRCASPKTFSASSDFVVA